MKKKLFNEFKNKTIIVTGHTGFKGSWLTLWLQKLGAKVIGISKSKKHKNSHFNDLNLNKKIKNYFFDLKSLKKTKKIFTKHKPDYVFHLAGQSIVKKSYSDPIETIMTNSIGTLNVLECLRNLKKKCNAVLITSDKVYKNIEISRGYKEDDIIGGKDPYSASKSSAEIIIESYISSFLSKKTNLKVAVARAGNVIGGGDWNQDRLIPDCMKSWSKKRIVVLRNPKSTRPWQNVLDVVRGYMILAIKLKKNSKINGQAFNFGPSNKENYTVIQVVKYMQKHWNNVKWKVEKSQYRFFESQLLKLNSDKAKKYLGWKSKLSMNQSLKMTIDWYKNYFLAHSQKKYSVSEKTLRDYEDLIN